MPSADKPMIPTLAPMPRALGDRVQTVSSYSAPQLQTMVPVWSLGVAASSVLSTVFSYFPCMGLWSVYSALMPASRDPPSVPAYLASDLVCSVLVL
jgi:hypothetical protein